MVLQTGLGCGLLSPLRIAYVFCDEHFMRRTQAFIETTSNF